MATFKTREIRKGLKNKGFIEENRKHKFYILIFNNKKTNIRTWMSHGEEEINDILIGCMARQTRLSKKDFLDLIKCPLSYDDYIKMLLKQNIIKV